jgi:hypothetical protein
LKPLVLVESFLERKFRFFPNQITKIKIDIIPSQLSLGLGF